MVKIRLRRLGYKKNPVYRIVVINSTTKREAAPIQQLGFYNPKTKEMKVTSEGLRTDGKFTKTTSEFVNDKIKDIKNKEKELKESIKTGNLNAMSDKLEDLQKSIDKGAICGTDPERIKKFLNEDK